MYGRIRGNTQRRLWRHRSHANYTQPLPHTTRSVYFLMHVHLHMMVANWFWLPPQNLITLTGSLNMSYFSKALLVP